MNREEAARMLMKFADACSKCDLTSKTPYIPAFRMGATALRGPVPDPETGLVPCGCGGKAQIINSSGYSRRLYVECDRCAIMLGVEATGDGAFQGIYRYDDQIIKDWNRAMGILEVEG